MTDWGAVSATLSGTVLGWLVALVQSGAQQDRDRLFKLRGIARALRAEVERIHAELGDREHGSMFTSLYGHKPIVPAIHEWFRPLIPEIAAADSEILSSLLELDRSLVNYRAFSDTAERWRVHVEEQRDAIREGNAIRDKRPPLPDDIPNDELIHITIAEAIADDAATDELKRSQESAKDVNHLLQGERAALFRLLDRVEDQLRPLATLEIPSLLVFAINRATPRSPEDPPPVWQKYAAGNPSRPDKQR